MFQYQNQRKDIKRLFACREQILIEMYTDLGPAQITYYIQIKHAFWKTSRISWLWGAFVTVDTLWFRFVWKDVIAFHVLILLTG